MVTVEFLEEVTNQKGLIASERLAKCLRITKKELAEAIGLSLDAVSKRPRREGPKTQARLRDAVDIINRAAHWSGSIPLAFAWFRAEPLPSFGDKTAQELVKEGRGDDVKRYLARIAEGGYA